MGSWYIVVVDFRDIDGRNLRNVLLYIINPTGTSAAPARLKEMCLIFVQDLRLGSREVATSSEVIGAYI